MGFVWSSRVGSGVGIGLAAGLVVELEGRALISRSGYGTSRSRGVLRKVLGLEL